MYCLSIIGIFGDFMNKNKKLSIELVPASMAGINARAVLTPEQWQKLASICHRQHRATCAICGAKNITLECHEVWEYSNTTMKLVGLQSLCHLCHMSKHILFAKREVKVPFQHITQHIQKIFGVGRFKLAFLLWLAKIKINKFNKPLELDLTFLNDPRYISVSHSLNRPIKLFTNKERKNCRQLKFDDYS